MQLPLFQQPESNEPPKTDRVPSVVDMLRAVAPHWMASPTIRAFDLPRERQANSTTVPRWGNTGVMWNEVCITGHLAESPHDRTTVSLWGVIEKGEVPQKYFLSPHAARGILRRVQRLGRDLLPALRQALILLAAADHGGGETPTRHTDIRKDTP